MNVNLMLQSQSPSVHPEPCLENPTPPFFRLPLELRDIIYHMVLVSDKDRSFNLLERMYSDPRSAAGVQTAVTRVNRQMCAEALPILYRRYRVLIDLRALFDTLDDSVFLRKAGTFFIGRGDTVRPEYPLAHLQIVPVLEKARPRRYFHDNVFARFADIEIGMVFYGHVDDDIGHVDIDLPKMAGLATLIDMLSKGEEGPVDSDGLPLRSLQLDLNYKLEVDSHGLPHKSLLLDLSYHLENWTDEEVHANPVKIFKFKLHFMRVLDRFGGLTALKTLRKIRRVTITGDFEEKDFEMLGGFDE